jgi:uncharacterized protein (TIGR03000 family)
MTRLSLFAGAALVGGMLAFAGYGAAALGRATGFPALQTAAPSAARATSRMSVTLPQDDAELVIEGQTIPGSGTARDYETPPLPAGATQRYTVVATWRPNTYTTMTRQKTIAFRAGERVVIDLTVDDPNDRVRVLYVPTPQDIAEEMARLAAITAQDIVYEPGCGDARITIAAIKSGARRGLCVDIDPDRVTDSRAKIKAAGLEDKVEVRLGDALDIKELSSTTVVFLYMGDHFDMLIRPVLWRELPVGARVVSHRFTMGDWTPDKTISVSSVEGGEYQLHLWTITEELKRRVERR